jgi:hypothetical protein
MYDIVGKSVCATVLTIFKLNKGFFIKFWYEYDVRCAKPLQS